MRGITQGQSEQKIIKEKRGPERSTKDSKSRIKHNLIPDRFHQIISIGSGKLYLVSPGVSHEEKWT